MAAFPGENGRDPARDRLVLHLHPMVGVEILGNYLRIYLPVISCLR